MVAVLVQIDLNMKLKIPGLSEEQMFWLLHASMYKQYCEAVKRLKSGACPFCELDGNVNRIICENRSWFAWPNPWPQPHQSHHLVIAHRRHFQHLSELSRRDWSELGGLVKELATDNYQIQGGVFAMRFGNPSLSLASEEHLHANIRVPDGTGPVAVTVAWNKYRARKKVRITCVFEKMRCGTPFEKLPQNEQGLVEKFLD